MGQLGRSFQRIRYHRLRFEVVAGWPSVVSGTYVAGFVRDATDPVTEANAAATLLASGGTATKFWQSTNVTVGELPDLYYTSSDPEEQRWASPGSFVIAVVGPPSLESTFEVFCHWDVSFYEPSYEGGSRYEQGFSTVLADLYTSKGNRYLSKRSGNDWEPATWLDFSPPLFEGAIVTVLSMRSASTSAVGGTTINGVYNFRQLKATGNAVFPIDDRARTSGEPFFDECYILFKGEKLDVQKPPNVTVASWFLSTLRRHEHYGSFECRRRAQLQSQEPSLIGRPCFLMPTSSSTDPTPSTQPPKQSSSNCENLIKTSLTSSDRETLCRLMEQLMASRPLSRASSLGSFDPCDDATGQGEHVPFGSAQ